MSRKAARASGLGSRGQQVSPIWKSPVNWIAHHRREVTWAGTAYLALVSVLPILTTPYRSDDKVSVGIPAAIHGTGLEAIRSALLVVRAMFVPWMADRGRFFPGSALWTVSVFTAFPNRLSYKVFLGGLVLSMVVLTALVLRTLMGSAAAHVAVVTLAANLTLRNWFDGLDTFTGILPLTICLTLVAALLLLRGVSWLSAMMAGALWTYALITYEVAILLAPTLVLLVLARRKWQRTVPVILPTLGILAFVAFLRSRALNPPGDAYTISLDPSAVITTYVRQALSALPLAEQWVPRSRAHQRGFQPHHPDPRAGGPSSVSGPQRDRWLHKQRPLPQGRVSNSAWTVKLAPSPIARFD